MEITVQMNIKSASLSEAGHLTRHNTHDLDTDHRNRSLDPALHDLNCVEHLRPLDAVLGEVYGPEIEDRNRGLKQAFADGKLTLARYEERRVSSPREYLEKKRPVASFVLGVGSAEHTKFMLSALGMSYHTESVTDETGAQYDRVRFDSKADAEAWSAINYEACEAVRAKLEKRPGFELVGSAFHADEVPQHMHLTAVKHGARSKKTGKVSSSLDSSVVEFLGTDATGDPRENLRLFREVTDRLLLEAFQEALEKRGFELDVSLVRTGAESGLSMDARKALLDREKAISARERELDERKESLDQKELELGVWESQLLTLKDRLEPLREWYEATLKPSAKRLRSRYKRLVREKAEMEAQAWKHGVCESEPSRGPESEGRGLEV